MPWHTLPHHVTLVPAVAAEATRNGLPFHVSYLKHQSRASEVDRGGRPATCRRYVPPSVSLARRSRRSERSSCSTCHVQVQDARKVFWLTIRSLLPMKQMHTPPAPPADAQPSAQERKRQQRQQRWRRRRHCQAAAAAAARQGAQPLAGTACEAHVSFPVCAANVFSGGAADVRPQRHAAEGLQPMAYIIQMGEGTLNLLLTGRRTDSLSQQCFQPIST
jgi:hypothetical protein